MTEGEEAKLLGWASYGGTDGLPSPGDLEDTPDGRASAEWECERAVKAEIAARRYRFSGEYHQYGERGVPVLSLGGRTCRLAMSWRSWGALMAECWDEIERKSKYDYMDFYMDCGGETAAPPVEYEWKQEKGLEK